MTEYRYPDTYQGRENKKAAERIERWLNERCELDAAARTTLVSLYEAYCLDANRPAWPAARAVSVALFSQTLIKAGKGRIVRRKANKTFIVGVRHVGISTDTSQANSACI